MRTRLFTLWTGLTVCPLIASSVCNAQPAGKNDCRTLPVPSVARTISAKVRGEFLKNNRKTLVQDLYLKSDDGTQTRAFLIKPYKPAAPKGGAVLFVHLLGAPPDNDREEFFEDALELADTNVTSLLVEAPWADAEWFSERKLEQDLPNVLQYVALLEGQLKFLLDEAKPDPEKVALVGHDFGAMYGALLLPRQPAIKQAVIMAAVPDFADWFLLGRKLSKEEEEKYRNTVSPIAPSRYLRCAGKANILFQFAETDRFVGKKQADDFIASALGEKQTLWYAGGHELQEPSRKDRINWLKQRVGSASAADR
ncbi:MAG TPA: alpha/beta hydrolase [Pyrinomonadaceae bacterium]|jgi:predicted esterase|nr:alpha/beta hydrolase [Pyrinomonadaceae bacterium]